MTRRMLSSTCLVCALAVSSAHVVAEEADSSYFFLAPVKTDLQRTLISNEASAYLVVNCDRLIRDGQFSPDAVDLSVLETQLKALSANDPSTLFILLRFQDSRHVVKGRQAVANELRAEIAKIARNAGFKNGRETESYTSAEWSDVYAAAQSVDEQVGAEEQIIENELIRAYPIRTRLSSFVVGGADCVVEIKQPFDGRQQDLPEALRNSIKQTVESMDLKQKNGKLLYRVRMTSAGRDLVDRLFNPRQPPSPPRNVKDPAFRQILAREFAKRLKEYKPSPGLYFAGQLGFASIGCTSSYAGIAPEKLIGKPVPGFTLETLDGEKLELHSFLNGRPALITFWEVRDGTCRAEALHLSKLHEKYSADFAIVAVAYNESREVVSKFAAEKNLKHTIVLNGRNLAREEYQAGYIPTTFWINRDGIVEDYEIDFRSGEALEQHIKKMLE